MYVSADSSHVVFASLTLPFLVKYRSWNPDVAMQDYYNRVRGHEKLYETVDELDVPSIRIINVCSQFPHCCADYSCSAHLP